MNDEERIRRAIAANRLDLATQLLKHPLRFKNDPCGYCQHVLGVELWDKQVEIVSALVKHKRVLVRSANAIGKSYIAACLALWFYETHDPGICILTAPTERQVCDVTFKEIRRLWGNRAGLYRKMPRIQSAPDHYVHGFTATDATAFQGIHCDNLLVVFEECVGVAPEFWEAAEGILVGGQETLWLCICNPTDSASQAYIEEQSGRWHVISVSAFQHPNIALEIKGDPPQIPGAIRLPQIEEALTKWCQVVNDEQPGDIAFRGLRYRPGPIAEARLLGRYPAQGSYSVFSEADLNSCLEPRPYHPADGFHLGCDVARLGDDCTTIHARRGPVSILHESYNHRDTAFTAARLKAIVDDLAARWIDEKHPGLSPEQRARNAEQVARTIPVKIDDAGVGGGVVDAKGPYAFIGVNGGSRAYCPDDYPNRRSELLFALSLAMQEGRVSLAGLPRTVFDEIKRQAIGLTYKLDAAGRRVAERKDEQKQRIGRSPDDLDAVALCYSSQGVVLDFKPLNVKRRERRINF
jgi:hypothetical protein